MTEQKKAAEESPGIEEMDVGEVAPQLDNVIVGWLERANVGEHTPKVYLYKFDRDGTKQLISRWDNGEIPDEHGIGLMFGSGKYLAIVTLPGVKSNNVKAWKFSIHPYYDELRRQQAASGMPLQSGPGNAVLPVPVPTKMYGRTEGEESPTESGLKIVKEVIAMITPLLANANKGNPDMSAFGGLMMQNYRSLNDVMKQNLMENTKLYAELAKKGGDGAEGTAGDGEGDEEPPSMIEQVLPLLSEWIPVLLGSGPKATAAAATVKALPQFKQLTRDKGELGRVVSHLDKEVGKEKTDALLKKLKVNRPTAGQA